MKTDFNRFLMSLDVPVSGIGSMVFSCRIIDGLPGKFKASRNGW